MFLPASWHLLPPLLSHHRLPGPVVDIAFGSVVPYFFLFCFNGTVKCLTVAGGLAFPCGRRAGLWEVGLLAETCLLSLLMLGLTGWPFSPALLPPSDF